MFKLVDRNEAAESWGFDLDRIHRERVDNRDSGNEIRTPAALLASCDAPPLVVAAAIGRGHFGTLVKASHRLEAYATKRRCRIGVYLVLSRGEATD